MTQQPWGQQAQRPYGNPGWQQPQGQAAFGQQQWGGQNPWGAPGGAGRPQAGGMRPPSQVGQSSPYGQMSPYGQQWPGGPGQFPAPQPRKSPTKLIVMALAGLVALAMVFAVAQNLRGGGGGGGGGYQNEDYKVPPPDEAPPEIPMVGSAEEAKQALENNPMYKVSVPKPVRCEIDENLDLTTASAPQIKKHMDELTACLMRVWDEPLKKAGWTMVRPVSNVYSSQVSTPCGSAPTRNAFYCAGNQQIYYATDLPSILPPELRKGRFVIESIIAHEVGHAIQGRTSILVARYLLQRQAPDKSTALQLNRRLEVQADCLSGMFLGSVARSTNMNQSNLKTIEDLLFYIGDDNLSGQPNIEGDHGHGKNRRYWGQMGMASTSVGACNTFVAPAGQVR